MDAEQVKTQDEQIQLIQGLRKYARYQSHFLFDFGSSIVSQLRYRGESWRVKRLPDGEFLSRPMSPEESITWELKRMYDSSMKTFELMKEVGYWLNLANLELSQDHIRREFSTKLGTNEPLNTNRHAAHARETQKKCDEFFEIISNDQCSVGGMIYRSEYPETITNEQISRLEYLTGSGRSDEARMSKRAAILSLEASKAIHLIATTPYFPSQGRLYPLRVTQTDSTEAVVEDKLISHSVDFRSVHWLGETYIFTKNQALCIEVLWDHWKQKTPAIGHDAIIVEAGLSDNAKLIQTFERGKHPAWGTLIQSAGKGVYQLAKISD